MIETKAIKTIMQRAENTINVTLFSRKGSSSSKPARISKNKPTASDPQLWIVYLNDHFRKEELILQSLKSKVLIFPFRPKMAAEFYPSFLGRVKKKVLPSPGCDSTQIFPPFPSTIFLQIANPAPVPSKSS